MSWNFHRLQQYELANVDYMCFSGSYMLCLAGNEVHVVDYWIEPTDSGYSYEYVEYDDLEIGESANRDMYLQNIITLPSNAMFLVKAHDHFYTVTSSLDKIYKFDLTGTVTTINLPLDVKVGSNLYYARDKLWFVQRAYEVLENQTPSDRQKLYWYDLNTLSFSSVEIPDKKQFSYRSIAYPFNDEIYVSNYQNTRVHRFNVDTGAYIGYTTVNNRSYKVFATTDRDLYVCSTGGMISHLDSSTHTVTHHSSSVNGSSSPISIDHIEEVDGEFWYVGNDTSLNVMNTTTKDLKLTSSGADYGIETTKFDDGVFNALATTWTFDYQRWNGSSFDTITVPPYVFVTTDSFVYAIALRNLRTFYKQYYTQLKTVSMISTGAEDYTGD